MSLDPHARDGISSQPVYEGDKQVGERWFWWCRCNGVGGAGNKPIPYPTYEAAVQGHREHKEQARATRR